MFGFKDNSFSSCGRMNHHLNVDKKSQLRRMLRSSMDTVAYHKLKHMEKTEMRNSQSKFHLDKKRLSPERKFNQVNQDSIEFEETHQDLSPRRRTIERGKQGVLYGAPKPKLDTRV
jgi:replication initiation and membrane attachment protein DnaB